MKWACVGMVGLAVALAWANPAAAQERPVRPAPPRLPEGVRVLRDLPYVEGGHERQRLDLYLPERAEGPSWRQAWLPWRPCEPCEPWREPWEPQE